MMRVLGITSSCGFAVAALAACSNVHYVGHVSTSTADRPSAYRPAALGPDGVFHGTHFRVTIPAGWETGNTSSNDPHVEVAIKQSPLNQPNPVIVVTVGDSPSPTLPVEAYADILRNRALSDNSVSPVGGIHATTLAGQLAESYIYTERSSGGNTFRIIVSLRGGVSYIIEFAAPHDRFGTASSGPFRSFLSSWQWDLPAGQRPVSSHVCITLLPGSRATTCGEEARQRWRRRSGPAMASWRF
jgi:hypothetical protein